MFDQDMRNDEIHRYGYDNYGDNAPRHHKRKTGAAALLLCGCVTLSAAFGFGGGVLATRLNGQTVQPAQQQTAAGGGVPTTNLSNSGAGVMTVPQVTQAVSDSVVVISTKINQTQGYFNMPVMSQGEGSGSGVILTQDGYIITNNHVVEGASSIQVTLSDGTSYDATLIGTDDQTDVAVIKIDASGLTPAVIGDSDQMTVGEDVVAIGNPLGTLGGTVTNGIISALDREITIDNETMHLLQTNAAVNPGNSGGGLFNMRGELVGIVNAKSSGSDVEGLGFAIPINLAKSIADQLMATGSVERAYLNATLLDALDEQTMRLYRLDKQGVYVYSLNDASSALQVGDRIVRVDGQDIQTSSEVKAIVQSHQVGDVLSMVVERDGQTQTIEVTLRPELGSMKAML